MARMNPATSNLFECPECGWWGTRGDLDFGAVFDVFNGVASCPDCDTFEGLLIPITAPPQP